MKKWILIMVMVITVHYFDNAHAVLIDRGGGLIYDTILDVTWMQDANYINTTGYDDALYGYDTGGRISWDDAVNWADNLVYFDTERNVTWDNWRLPHVLPINGSSYNYTRSVVGQTDDGYNISAPGTIYAGSTGSELAYMFYNNMGNLSFYDLNGNPNQPGWGNPSPGIFVNLVETNFWTGTEYAPDLNKAWLFDFQSGGQYSDGKDITNPKYRAWALMDGDVASDTDSDGIPDCNDSCPNDPNKTEPGICGCSVTDTDTDSDGTPDCIDSCLNDPNKTQPSVCGCGISDIDSDGDGTPDCNDNCPNDPNKTQPGVCGCGTSDTDSDNDGIPDCNDDCDNSIDSDGDGTNDCDDLCPNDAEKTLPGVCGCGIFDIDSDGDGTNDCVDLCPNDPNKTQPGTCGCNIINNDSDKDGTPDCVDTNNDNDALIDEEEQGPDGNNPNYDGNDDGFADYLQNNVASFHTYDDKNYVTLDSPVGTAINICSAEYNPSIQNVPSDVEFSHGFFRLRIDGVDNGGANIVTLHLPVGETFDTYYKYGPTPDNPAVHWYEFLYDGQTGAKIDGNVITLYFVDGMRGDDNLTADGAISDIGGPGISQIISDERNNESSLVRNSGGGGGGCFISASAEP